MKIIKKILCRFGIHNWCEWSLTQYTTDTHKPFQVRYCLECKRQQVKSVQVLI